MKIEELKAKIDKEVDKHPNCDVMIDCGSKHYHVLFAKNINYNKRNSKFTPRVFLIQGTIL